MQKSYERESQRKQAFSPVFPLKFNAEDNIYILTDNSFASKLIELSISNKLQNHQKKQNYQWYIHPQEAMYLISVGTYAQEHNIYRKQFIRQIYKNCQPQDIDVIHFYLTLRKRNKLCRRVDNFRFIDNLKVIGKTGNPLKKIEQLKKYNIFKIYQASDDYKMDRNFNLFLFTQTQQQICLYLFDPNLKIVKQALGIQTLHICIIQNNDFVVVEVKQN